MIQLLFSLTPKAKKEDLFDREKELSELTHLVEMYPIVVVTGLRRVGKSSLIRVFLKESELPFVLVDGRKLYEMASGNISSLHFSQLLNSELSRLSKSQKILNFLTRIRGISVGGSSLEIDHKEFNLSDLLEKFDEIAQKEKKHFVLFLDEAQYLRYYGSRGGNDILALLAYCYDHLENVRILITGSEVGMLHDFLKLDSYDSPLYGRGIGFLTLKPFSFDQSVEFLRKGFEEVKEKIDFDPNEVVKKIDGIAGYLVLFGVKYLEKKSKDKALDEVFHTAKALFEKELNELKKRSPRYLSILKYIAQGANSWSAVKNICYANRDFVADSRLYSLLGTLEKMSLIEKTAKGYKIVDPVLEKLLT